MINSMLVLTLNQNWESKDFSPFVICSVRESLYLCEERPGRSAPGRSAPLFESRRRVASQALHHSSHVKCIKATGSGSLCSLPSPGKVDYCRPKSQTVAQLKKSLLSGRAGALSWRELECIQLERTRVHSAGGNSGAFTRRELGRIQQERTRVNSRGENSGVLNRRELGCIWQKRTRVHLAGENSGAFGTRELGCIRQERTLVHLAGENSGAFGRRELGCIRQERSRVHLAGEHSGALCGVFFLFCSYCIVAVSTLLMHALFSE